MTLGLAVEGVETTALELATEERCDVAVVEVTRVEDVIALKLNME